MPDDEPAVVKKKLGAWTKLKTKSTLAPLEKGHKWNPAIGKDCFLNKIWVSLNHNGLLALEVRPGGRGGTLETRLHSFLGNSLPFPNM